METQLLLEQHCSYKIYKMADFCEWRMCCVFTSFHISYGQWFDNEVKIIWYYYSVIWYMCYQVSDNVFYFYCTHGMTNWHCMSTSLKLRQDCRRDEMSSFVEYIIKTIILYCLQLTCWNCNDVSCYILRYNNYADLFLHEQNFWSSDLDEEIPYRDCQYLHWWSYIQSMKYVP